ncbi:asparagine synthase-related protein [Gracilimonas sp.]|uniref:asparagine synthase-related protein n=1 Tax=Gracilimonas sp. TaxID=1974203 RepID=UPI00287204D7|nr:asparagine synthase-related protein [Gracilimonas sp.]
MGWFAGIHGVNPPLRKQLRNLCSNSSFSVENENLFITAGGHSSTSFFQSELEDSKGWVTCGIGIGRQQSATSIFQHNDWERILEEESTDPRNLSAMNGHFAVAKWNDDRLELFTDQLGLRNIFIYEGNGYTLFSTRLDWIKKLISEVDIDWEKFGSRWLAINQFSNDSFLHGVNRLSQGGYASITPNNNKISNRRWTYAKKQTSAQEFEDGLFHFTSLPLEQDRELSLGLSGGLDSRVLFATLLKKPEANWGLHTFAEEQHPDLHTVQQLNTHFNRKHRILEQSIPELPDLEHQLPEFVGQVLFTAAPSHLVTLQAYNDIRNETLSVVDGGFGEIARRRFMVSLLLKEKKAILEKNISRIMPHLFLHRADIFTDEVHQHMLQGFEEELTHEIEAMPEAKDIGVENWLDLFTIRTRVPNGAGPEQSRSDAELFNYMPFLQPELIQQVLNLPIKQRKNAQLLRAIIKKNAPVLQQVNLVKGTTSYPYWLKDVPAALWMRLKQKAGLSYESTLQVHFLNRLEPYVRDLHNSSSVRNYSPYDQKKITNLIRGFYDEENTKLAGELNWWLAFEVFRRI